MPCLALSSSMRSASHIDRHRLFDHDVDAARGAGLDHGHVLADRAEGSDGLGLHLVEHGLEIGEQQSRVIAVHDAVGLEGNPPCSPGCRPAACP